MDTEKQTLISYCRRILFFLFITLVGITLFTIPAFATGTGTNTGTSSANANVVMGNLISLMCSMFKFVGGAIFVWAVIQFILATKRSDADSKADAIQTSVCGIALMGVASVTSSMGIGSDIALNIHDNSFGSSTNKPAGNNKPEDNNSNIDGATPNVDNGAAEEDKVGQVNPH